MLPDNFIHFSVSKHVHSFQRLRNTTYFLRIRYFIKSRVLKLWLNTRCLKIPSLITCFLQKLFAMHFELSWENERRDFANPWIPIEQRGCANLSLGKSIGFLSTLTRLSSIQLKSISCDWGFPVVILAIFCLFYMYNLAFRFMRHYHFCGECVVLRTLNWLLNHVSFSCLTS